MILAAGLGSRLRPVVADRPKGFVDVAGEPLIARSTRLLRAAGVTDFVLVVGWRAEHYREWAAAQPATVRCIENREYATTGSLRSLILGLESSGARDVVLVESDLLFEARAARAVAGGPPRDVILLSGPTRSGDEVWAYGRTDGRLRRLTKTAEPGVEPRGELVGLSRIHGPALDALRAAAFALPAEAHYEDGLTAIAAEQAIALQKVDDLAWCEIDDAAHLERARREVWPRIRAREEGGPAGQAAGGVAGDVPRKILLNPGPATTTDQVKRALVVPDICPRERDFGDLVRAVRADLLAVADADPATATAVLLAGPGTAAMEAAIGSLVPREGRLLVVENGAYGQRAGEIAATLGVPAHVWRVPWTHRPSPEEFAQQLDGGAGPFTHAFWVHHETTTGLLNGFSDLGAVCRARGVTSLVDTMSSFAGVELSLRRSPVDFVLSSANKCLQGMPGVSFVIGPREAILAARGRRTYSLDLARHETALAGGQFPFTPPVQVVYALRAALQETLAETVPQRAARYRACYRALLDGMLRLGFDPLLPRELHSGLLTAFRLPDWPGFTFEALHDHLYVRDVTLYPGKLPGTETFRVANLGALTPSDLHHFVQLVDAFLHAK